MKVVNCFTHIVLSRQRKQNENNIQYGKVKRKEGESKAVFLSSIESLSVLVLGFAIDVFFAQNVKDVGLVFSMLGMMAYHLCAYFLDFPVYWKGWQDKKDKLINAGIWFFLFIVFQIRFYYS